MISEGKMTSTGSRSSSTRLRPTTSPAIGGSSRVVSDSSAASQSSTVPTFTFSDPRTNSLYHAGLEDEMVNSESPMDVMDVRRELMLLSSGSSSRERATTVESSNNNVNASAAATPAKKSSTATASSFISPPPPIAISSAYKRPIVTPAHPPPTTPRIPPSTAPPILTSHPLSASQFTRLQQQAESPLASGRRPIPKYEYDMFDAISPGRQWTSEDSTLPKEFQSVMGLPHPMTQARPPSHSNQPPVQVASMHSPTPPPRHQRKTKSSLAQVRAAAHSNESWTGAARTSIPLQYDPTAVTGAVKSHQTILEIQEQTKRMIAADALKLYKEVHATERERREKRDKPWRAGCAIEAEAASLYGRAAPAATPSSNSSAEEDNPFTSLSYHLSTLLNQYAASQQRIKAERKTAKLREKYSRVAEERRREREKAMLHLRQDAEEDEKMQAIQAEVEEHGATADGTHIKIGDEILTDDDFLANSTNPLAKLLRRLEEKVNEEFIYHQIVERLISDRHGGEHALLSKPLRFLLQRVQAHYTSMMEPLKQLLEQLSEKLIQEFKINHLINSNANSISSVGLGGEEEEKKASNNAAASASASTSTSVVPAASDHTRQSSSGAFGANVVDLLDHRSVLASSSTTAATTARIHALQKRHLHRLEDELRAEYQKSLDTEEALREVKESLSAKVHHGLFRQTYTKVVRRKAKEMADMMRQGEPLQEGAGSAFGKDDPGHKARHVLDYDLANHSLVEKDLFDSNHRPLPKHYLEDDIDHALDDEDPASVHTHYVGVMRKKVRLQPGSHIRKLRSEEDVKNERHMASMRKYISTFHQQNQNLPPGVVPPPITLAPSAFRPSLDNRCNTTIDYRTLRQELRDFGLARFVDERIAAGAFVRGVEGVEINTQIVANPFARLVAKKLKPSHPDLLCEYGLQEPAKEFMVVRNQSGAAEHWLSYEPEWLGKASMSQRHEFLVLRSLDWSTFNVLTFGCGGKQQLKSALDRTIQCQELKRCIQLLDRMDSVARTYTARAGWSNDLGLFFHAFPFCTIHALHLHMVDLSCVGPTFQVLSYKNLPLEDVREALLEELEQINPDMAESLRETNQAIIPAIQGLVTRPVLRIHALSSGDILSGQVGYQSYYYLFKLSTVETGAWIRLIQHPSNLYQQYAGDRGDDPSSSSPTDQRVSLYSTSSPSASEDEFNFLDLYLNAGSPPTRLKHTHKATTKMTGMCSVDLRTGAENGNAAQAFTMQELITATGAARSTEWFIRIIGRGMRPKGFTLEFRTNTEILDYSNVFNQLLSDLESQSAWQESLSEKMVTVDQLLAAFLPKPTFAEPSDAPHAGLVAMYPNPAERPATADMATQTHVSALHEIDVEATLRRREEEENLARILEAERIEEENRHVISLGGMKRLFKYPLQSLRHRALRVWSQNSLLKFILQVYKAKLVYDVEFEEQLIQWQLTTSQTTQGAGGKALLDVTSPPGLLTPPKKLAFNEFVYGYFCDRYGLVKLSEHYIREFVHSVEKKYLSIPRVTLFSRMMEIFTPYYQQVDIDFFFVVIKAMWKWCNTHNVLPYDNSAGRCTLPYYVLEDTLFDVFNITQIQAQAKILANNSKLGTTNTGTSSSTRASNDRELELVLKLQEVGQVAWAQMLLKKLSPFLQVKETIHVHDHQNHLLAMKNAKIERTYLMDSDEFLQVLIDHSSRSLTKTIELLKSVWMRMASAYASGNMKQLQKELGSSLESPFPIPQQDRTKLTATAQQANGRIGLKLPDFLGFLRVEFPWLDDMEGFLLYYECVHSSSGHRSEDSVYIDSFIRIGIRYEIMNPPVPEGNEVEAPEPMPSPTTTASPSSTTTTTASPSSTTIVATSDKRIKSTTPTSQLHLTTHRLPFPALVLPGFKELTKEQLRKKEAAASSGASGSGGGATSSNYGQGAIKKKKKKLPHFAQQDPPPPPKYLNTGKLVFDEFAEARLLPVVDKHASSSASHRSNTLGLGVLTTDTIRRPPSLLDSSIHLPPSLTPPASLKPTQSLKLLSALNNRLQPIIIDHLNRIQIDWHLPGMLTADDLQRRSTRLTQIYELLSELQMNLDRRTGKGPILVYDNDKKQRVLEDGTLVFPDSDDDSLYEEEGEAEKDTTSTTNPPSPHRPGTAASTISGSGSRRGGGGRKNSPLKFTTSELESMAQTCWALFRQLLSHCSDLLILDSPLHQELNALQSTDGKSMVSTEYGTRGDVYRALASGGRRISATAASTSTSTPKGGGAK